MACQNCGKPNCTCGKDHCAPAAAVQINNMETVLFRKVTIPASVGDDTTNPPVPGAFCNALVYYEATGAAYLYSSDGIPTRIDGHGNIDEIVRKLNKEIQDRADADAVLQGNIDAEARARGEADQEIWQEINTIEAASDVVDVVGTYAELQQYDTSKLHDKDLIKVLADETHDDAITYYRWSTTSETFSYVGAEGPYYTTAETDTLLSGKQDKLTAGANITISAQNEISATDTTYTAGTNVQISSGNVISATDTTYTHFTGATASTDGVQGLVPGPLAGDENKVLKGDGTWGTVQGAANTIFYMNSSESGSTRHIYKSPDMTGLASSKDIFDANELGQVILRISTSVTPDQYSDCYLQNAYKATGDYQLLFLDEKTYRSFDTTNITDTTFYYGSRVLQSELTAGTNIQINGTTISATDTTYSNFVGSTGSADGAAGLVPQPLIADTGKFLKGDGTWGTPADTTYTAGTNVNISAQNVISATDTTYTAGANVQISAQNVISATDTTYSAFGGATSSVAGSAGLVPAPTTSDPDKYLKGDGTWSMLPAANNISSNDWNGLWQ